MGGIRHRISPTSLLTVVSGSCLSCFPLSPGWACTVVQGSHGTRTPCHGSKWRLDSSPHSAAQAMCHGRHWVACTQHKELVLRCSMGSPPVSRSHVHSICSLVSLFLPSTASDWGGSEGSVDTKCLGQEGSSCLLEGAPPPKPWHAFPPPYQCCKLSLKIALPSLTPWIRSARACLQSWMAKAKR